MQLTDHHAAIRLGIACRGESGVQGVDLVSGI